MKQLMCWAALLNMVALGCNTPPKQSVDVAPPTPLPESPDQGEAIDFGALIQQGADCTQEMAYPDMCEEETPECARQNARSNASYQVWRLKCQKTMPKNPVETEHILAYVPFHGTRPDACMAMGRKVIRDGDTIRVEFEVQGECDGMGHIELVDLGKLEPGDYKLEASSGYKTTFKVRPADTTVEPFDEAFLVALAVAQQHQPGTCFGMPGPIDARAKLDNRAFDETRAGTQMKRLHPDLQAQERQELFESATRIKVEPHGENQWRYSFDDGRCCTIDSLQGDATRKADGGYQISKPVVVKSRSVPC